MKHNSLGLLCKLVSLVTALLATQSVLAAGFYISEVGTPLSLGTAGAANPTNNIGADSSWANPAGMTGLNESRAIAGLQVVAPNIRFDSSVATAGGSDGGNAGNAVAIPSFFYVNAVTDRLRLGISSAGIMGGGVDYGDDFVGRYATSLAELGAVGMIWMLRLIKKLSWSLTGRTASLKLSRRMTGVTSLMSG
jgi:long-chain fatty acid transport protein